MSGPRNNLSDILKRRPQASSAVPAMSASQSQEGSTKPKFRAATKPSTSVLPVVARVPDTVQKAPSHTSFSTPGFGKKKPAPLSGPLSSPVVISSTDSTPTSAQDQRTTTMAVASSTPIAQMITGLPSKRSSPSAFHVSEPPSKRQRPAAEAYPSDKENLFESSEENTLVSDVDDVPQPPHSDKGKGRDIPHDSVPPASQRIIDFSVTTPARHSSRTLVRTPAPRTLPRPLQFASNLHKPVGLDSPVSLSQPTSIAAVGSAVEGADGRARRSATLDYSGLLVMSVEELLIAKDKILNMRAAMIDLRGNLDGDAGTDQVRIMLRDYDDLTQDRLLCIDALISALRSGRPSTLPPPKWAPPSYLPSVAPGVAPPVSSSSQAIEVDSTYDSLPARDQRPSLLYEPYDGPDIPEEEPDFDEPMFDNAAPGQYYGPPSPDAIDSGPDSDDALWGHFGPDSGEVEIVDDPPLQPVASSSTQMLHRPSRTISVDSSRPYEPDAELTKRPYYRDLVDVRESVFKIRSWRENQLETICSIMDGHDTFNLMPTGGGKSLTFQLPAVVMNRLKKRITIIISPLIALMIDQQRSLEERGVNTVILNSESTQHHTSLLHDHGSRPALVYVSPEKIITSPWLQKTLLELYHKDRLFMLAVDEAHTITSWGNTFRETLSELCWLRENLPNTPIMALTATATVQHREEIINTLRIPRCKLFAMSLNRPNLNYVVKPKSDRNGLIKDIAEFIQSKHFGQTGIIYRQSRKDCEDLATILTEAWGIPAEAFHGKLEPEEKKRVQARWQMGEIKVVVATIAFGMGVDKKDVRFVIHYALPGSMSEYYQETGRAGRDGNPSDCILYYQYSDAQWLMKCAFQDGKNEIARQQLRADARRVVEYCLNNTDCRRTQTLSYFSQEFPREMCKGQCDNCRDKSPINWEDVSFEAYDFIRLAQEVHSSRQDATRIMLIDTFLGKTGESVKNKRFDQLGSFGVRRGTNRGRAERLFDELTCKQVFETHYVCNNNTHKKQLTEYFLLTTRGRDFLRNKEKLTMPFRDPPPRAKKTKSGDAQGTKRKGRGKKTAEIAEDPIEDDEDYAPRLTFPDDVDGTAKAAQPSTRRVAATAVVAARKGVPATGTRVAAKSKSTVVREIVDSDEDDDDDDDDIAIIDPPPRSTQASSSRAPRTRDEVVQQCYQDLVTRRDKIAARQEIDNDEIVNDEALQYISATLPEDVQELRHSLTELGVDIKTVEAFLPALIHVILEHRANLPSEDRPKSKPPSSKKTLGTRSKPPSVSELHSNYEFRQGGSSAAWPPARRRK